MAPGTGSVVRIRNCYEFSIELYQRALGQRIIFQARPSFDNCSPVQFLLVARFLIPFCRSFSPAVLCPPPFFLSPLSDVFIDRFNRRIRVAFTNVAALEQIINPNTKIKKLLNFSWKNLKTNFFLATVAYNCRLSRLFHDLYTLVEEYF